MRTILIIKGPLALAIGIAVAAVSCGETTAGSAAGPMRIVATTTVVSEIAARVGGDATVIETLIPGGADPHDFRASSRQAAALRNADLVISNGLGLEQGLADVIDDAIADGVPVLKIAPSLDPIPLSDGSGLDPHFWMDPLRVAAAAELIAERLTQIDEGPWLENAGRFGEELATVDQMMVELLEAVPERRLVTNHDSLGYLASRHGFEIVGVIIPGGTTIAEPSSADLAALVDVLAELDIPAIFIDGGLRSDVAEAIAAEVGEVSIVELRTTSIGDPGAATIAEMLLAATQTIARALTP